MNIIGRKEEKKEFHRLFNSSKPQLVVIHGRRGVGVSTFTKEMLKDRVDFSFSITSEKPRLIDNLALWQKAINEINEGKKFKQPINWREAFDQLKTLLTRQKSKSDRKIVVLDSFEKMNTSGSEMTTAFYKFWKSWGLENDSSFVIISGVTTSWKIRLLQRKNTEFSSLYTGEIQLKPFSLYETEQFLKRKGLQLSKEEIVKYYMILGGVPLYLNQIHKTGKISHNIKRIFSLKSGKLKNEFKDLMDTFIVHQEVCTAMLVTLAAAKHGLTRDVLIKKTGYKSGGSVTNAITEMIKAGWIESYTPWNTNRYHAVYKLIDPFIQFHFRIQSTNILDQTTVADFNFDHPKWKEWAGVAFTNLCIYHVTQLKRMVNTKKEKLSRTNWHRQANDSLTEYQQDLIFRGANRKTFVFDFIFSENKVTLDEDYYTFFYKKFEAYRYFTQKKQIASPVAVTLYGFST